MRFVFAIPEAVVCALLTIGGLYMLNEGMVDHSPNAAVLIIAGAAILAFGGVTLQAAVRSILWHRAMLRRTVNRQTGPTEHIAANHE